jgi:NitT/TauT family transport system substrate-binding protein
MSDTSRSAWLRRILLPSICMLAAAFGAAGCGSSAQASHAAGPEKPDLVVGTVPTASAAGLYLAQQDGFFAKAGLHVKIVNITTAADAIPAMLHGSVDVVNGAYPGFIEAQVKGVVKLHILADGYNGAPHVDEVAALPTAHITSPAGLKGKTIGVNAPNSIGTLLMSSVLADYGITPNQVHFVPIPFPAMPAALAAHRVDAAYLPEPYLSLTEKQTGAQEIFDINQGGTTDFPIAAFFATDQFMKKYPRSAAAFAKAISQGQAMAAGSRVAVEHVLTSYTAITPQVSALMALGRFPVGVDTVQDQRVADLMLRFGMLQQPFKITAMTTGS